MRLRTRTFLALTLAGVLDMVLVRVSVAQSGPRLRYDVIGLGVLNGNVPYSEADGLNDLGQVVGTSGADDKGTSHSFIWQAGKLVDIGASIEALGPGGTGDWALRINDFGQILGGGNSLPPYVWQSGKLEALNFNGSCFPGTNNATGINDLGNVVGTDCEGNGLVWRNGNITYLPATCSTCLPGSVLPFAINDVGQIVGEAIVEGSSLSLHAVLSQDGKVTDLGTLGGDSSVAYAVNVWGQVVGVSQVDCGGIPNSCVHAFLWQNGKMQDLGTLTGDDSSQAVSINALGQVVGVSFSQSGGRAFLWERGTMSDLNDLIPTNSGWDLVNFTTPGGRVLRGGPTGINNLQQISGIGSITGQVNKRAYLLVPRH